MPIEYLGGIPTTWDPNFKVSDFCQAGTRCVVLDGSTRSSFLDDTEGRYQHWWTHLRLAIDAHQGQLEYVRDETRAVDRGVMPVKPRLLNRAGRRAATSSRHSRAERKNVKAMIESDRANRFVSEAERAQRTAKIERFAHQRALENPREAAHRVDKLSDSEARDVALKQLESRDATEVLTSARSIDSAERAIRSNPSVARRVLLTERPEYHEAFRKMVLHGDGRGSAKWQTSMTDDERRAMLEVYEYQQTRDQLEGTNADGGYAVPVWLDPSIIISSNNAPNPFLTLCRVVDMGFGKEWKGLLSAGSTGFAFQAEAAEVGDASLTGISQPDIPVHTARAGVRYSVEVGDDWSNFAAEFQSMLAVSYDNLLVTKFSSGSGTGEPTGILTSLTSNSATTLVTSATSGAFADVDVTNVWAALPTRFRQNSTWIGNETVANLIRLNSKLYHASTVTLDDTIGAAEILNGRQFVECSAFPVWTSTTGATTRLVIGDWSNYVIARRQGLNVEVVGLVPNVADNRPDGTRALFATARIGADCVNPNAFRYQGQ